MRLIRIGALCAGLFVAAQAQAETSPRPSSPARRAALAPLHCPLPGDPDGMAARLGPQGQMYCAGLEDFILALETPGVETLQKALEKSFERGVYNEWTLLAEDVLSEFVPAYASPIRELPLVASQSLN